MVKPPGSGISLRNARLRAQGAATEPLSSGMEFRPQRVQRSLSSSSMNQRQPAESTAPQAPQSPPQTTASAAMTQITRITVFSCIVELVDVQNVAKPISMGQKGIAIVASVDGSDLDFFSRIRALSCVVFSPITRHTIVELFSCSSTLLPDQCCTLSGSTSTAVATSEAESERNSRHFVVKFPNLHEQRAWLQNWTLAQLWSLYCASSLPQTHRFQMDTPTRSTSLQSSEHQHMLFRPFARNLLIGSHSDELCTISALDCAVQLECCVYRVFCPHMPQQSFTLSSTSATSPLNFTAVTAKCGSERKVQFPVQFADSIWRSMIQGIYATIDSERFIVMPPEDLSELLSPNDLAALGQFDSGISELHQLVDSPTIGWILSFRLCAIDSHRPISGIAAQPIATSAAIDQHRAPAPIPTPTTISSSSDLPAPPSTLSTSPPAVADELRQLLCHSFTVTQVDDIVAVLFREGFSSLEDLKLITTDDIRAMFPQVNSIELSLSLSLRFFLS